jgi:hypothetical protein
LLIEKTNKTATMEWLRNSVFGGVGDSDEQQQQNSAAAGDEDEPSA